MDDEYARVHSRQENHVFNPLRDVRQQKVSPFITVKHVPSITRDLR